MACHFGAGLVCCEHPFDAGAGGVSLPFQAVISRRSRVVDAAIQALGPQEAHLDLDHVEPACVLGSAVELESSHYPPCFGGRERPIQGAGAAGREIADDLGIGIMDVNEIAHALGIVLCGSPVGDLDLAPGPMHVEEDEEIRYS